MRELDAMPIIVTISISVYRETRRPSTTRRTRAIQSSQPTLRLAIISTFDIAGGAAKAASRLYQGLKSGEDTWEIAFAVAKRFRDDPAIIELGSNQEPTFLEEQIQTYYIDANRTPLSNTKFSWTTKGRRSDRLDLLHDIDVINLHWVEKFFSLSDFQKIVSLRKPVVWTLHDQRPFTGGCHYSSGCEQYVNHCRHCCQLRYDPLHLPQRMFNKRLKIFQDADLTVVSPSKWLADKAAESPIFRDKHIHVIPNSIDTDLYKPGDKEEARKHFGIREDSTVIQFSAHSLTELRKGLSSLEQAIKLCLDNATFRGLYDRGLITLLAVGEKALGLQRAGVNLKYTGYLTNERDVVASYNAADIFVLPTLEDNLPCTLMESMACGTAVIAYDAGGVPELVKGEAGRLVPKAHPELLAREILALVEDFEARAELGKNARQLIERDFPLDVQSSRYRRLFRTVVSHAGQPGSRTGTD